MSVSVFIWADMAVLCVTRYHVLVCTQRHNVSDAISIIVNSVSNREELFVILNPDRFAIETPIQCSLILDPTKQQTKKRSLSERFCTVM